MQITGGDTIDHVGILQRPYESGVIVYATVKNITTSEIVVLNEPQTVTNENGKTKITLNIPTTDWKYNPHELELRIVYANGLVKTSDNTIKIDVKRPLSTTCTVV